MTLDFVDTAHIAITGHSRGGKAVLLAGATDERIAYTYPNGSGTHGAGPYRFIQCEEEDAGFEDTRSEPLDFLFRHVPHWMGEDMRAYIGKEETLPHDSHFLKALIAPRYYLETNGYADIWANPRGSYLSLLAAREVFRLLGAEGRCLAFTHEGGHRHTPADFSAILDMMEAAIGNTPLPEALTRAPYDDMEPLHDWKTPTA